MSSILRACDICRRNSCRSTEDRSGNELVTTKKYVKNQKFLGLAGFSAIVVPLTQLTRKDVKFEWTDDCEHSFQELKTKLTTVPILTHIGLGSPDTRTKLVGLEKFAPDFNPIDGRVGSNRVKMVDFSVIFCRVGRVRLAGWAGGLSD